MTLKAAIRTTGVGLHTGARVELVLRPALPDAGVVFHRVDLATPVAIPADALHVGDTRLSSTLCRDGVSISTVEHLMSALAGLLAGYNGGLSRISQPPDVWPDETRRYVAWGSAIYADVTEGRSSSPAVQAWLEAGGARLCHAAAQPF